MKDLSVFFVAYLESLLLPQVRGFGGLAALLLGSNRLTGYQHKLLKLQEKAAIDILTTAINLIIYIETEVLVKNVINLGFMIYGLVLGLMITMKMTTMTVLLIMTMPLLPVLLRLLLLLMLLMMK